MGYFLSSSHVWLDRADTASSEVAELPKCHLPGVASYPLVAADWLVRCAIDSGRATGIDGDKDGLRQTFEMVVLDSVS